MSAGDVTARSVLELRESMIETTMDDRWCARSVCEDAIEALEASRAEVDALRSGEAVAAPPQDTVPPVETEFKREDRYIVIKRSDLERHATPAQLRELERTCEMIRFGRMNEGKRLNSYVVVADDWPEYEEVWAKIQARMTGTQIQGIRPTFRSEVVAAPPPDMVMVPREEWISVEDRLPEDGQNVGFITDSKGNEYYHRRVYGGRFHRSDWDMGFGGFNTHGLGSGASHWFPFPTIPDALRTSAQDHNETEKES